MESLTSRSTLQATSSTAVPGRALPIGVIAAYALLGLAGGLSSAATLLFVVAAVLAVGIVGNPESLGRAILILAIVVPGALWRPRFSVLDVKVDALLMLPVLAITICVVYAALDRKTHLRRLPSAARVLLTAAAVWLACGAALAVWGAANNGLTASLWEFEYVVMWGWCALPALAFARGRPWDLHRTIRTLVIGSALYSLVMIMLRVAPIGVASGEAAGSGRVGFGNGELLVLMVPVALCLMASPNQRVMARWMATLAGVLMLGALAVSQSRASIAAALLNCVLTWFAIGRRSPGEARGRVVETVFITLSVLVFVGALLFLANVSRVQELPAQLAERFSTITSDGQDLTLLVRQYTTAAAFARWRADAGSVTVGHGLGTLLTVYSPYGKPALVGLFVDNVWAILAVKGGLLALIPFGGLIAVIFGNFVHAARRALLPIDKRVWRTLVVSYPLFLVSGTLFTAHLYATPAVVLAVCTLAAMAALEFGAVASAGAGLERAALVMHERSAQDAPPRAQFASPDGS